MHYKSLLTLLVLITICFNSCDRPDCTNENPIFVANEPNSKTYKDELVRQLNVVDESELRYWLQKYENNQGTESLYFHIQGDSLCAILHMSMNQWDKLERVRDNKGVGRRGAEFTNLSFEIVQDSTSTSFLYHSFDRIID